MMKQQPHRERVLTLGTRPQRRSTVPARDAVALRLCDYCTRVPGGDLELYGVGLEIRCRHLVTLCYHCGQRAVGEEGDVCEPCYAEWGRSAPQQCTLF